MRAILELNALQHAVPLHTERSLRRLEAVQRDLDYEHQPVEWVRFDRAFHEELYGPSSRAAHSS